MVKKWESFGDNVQYVILKDCVNEDTIYGILKVASDEKGNYNIDKIQNRIYELKEEIGEDYTVNDVMTQILDEFENVIEYCDMTDFLEI